MTKILLHLGKDENVNMLPLLKKAIGGQLSVDVINNNIEQVAELIVIAKRKGAEAVATNSAKVLQLLLDTNKTPSINDYAGSIIDRLGMEFLIVPPLDWLVTKNTGQFLFKRYFSKFSTPHIWLDLPKFTWHIFEPSQLNLMLQQAKSASFISVDIETIPNHEDKVMSCCGVGITNYLGANNFQVIVYVLPLDNMYNFAVLRRVLDTPAPKVLQNGKYDIAYLLRFNVPMRNYAFDTINLFHSWYSELPKSLDFIASFMLRKWQYWKDENNSAFSYEHYQYNAKDCYATSALLIALLKEMPSYAIRNYEMEFATVLPCILAEMTGIRVDKQEIAQLNLKLTEENSHRLSRIQTMVGNFNYNPNSSQQTVRLFEILGCGSIKSSDRINTDKVAAAHPLNKRILKEISSYKEDVKMAGTYLQESKVWAGRMFYTLNPHGTDTGRLASKESAYWCGMQIQNIPRDKKTFSFKSIFKADPGFYFGEADGEQAEARTTAYITGDTGLIHAVEDMEHDYHGSNASKFFGIPYEQIVNSYYDDETSKWVHKTIDTALRDLAKRTNHGANYNMGPSVMLDTMGIENVIRARKLLKLPASWPLLKVTTYLLEQFAKTYPIVKGAYQNAIKANVSTTKLLVGATGWTRYCFGHPNSNKLDLNSYVAHGPQSLNAMIMNQAWIKVYNNVWRKNPKDFRLLAQIHDSIFFQYRIGREDLAYQVKKEMEIPIKVSDIFRIERTLVVPIALKGNSDCWATLKKM